MPHTGQGEGAEELALGRGGTRASEQQLGDRRPGSRGWGVGPGETGGRPGGLLRGLSAQC